MNHLFNIHSSTSKGLIALVISLLLSIPSLANSSAEPLPELGDSAAGLMAPAQEQSLGQAWLRSYRKPAF
jgi:predicted Zn-dependent protease